MLVGAAHLALGIDTGGTYTDAVIVDGGSGAVQGAAKGLTTRHDLTIGIRDALDRLPPFDPSQVRLAALSTTLATNAAVEGLGGLVCLILLGYDAAMMRQYGLDRQIHAAAVVHVQGRHDVFGVETAPLDEAGLREVFRRYERSVDAFAISSYLAVRNPAHELRVQAIARELTSKPVVLGGDLSGQLNSIRRATTAALNARLIPVTQRLIDAVEQSLAARGITAPLSIVRGDGSLMGATLARARPIEMVLSGPAASAIGAHRLTGLDDAVVVDMGGTTTDIAVLRGGRPKVTERGAEVGGWRTAVRAADIQTSGLGGDSRVVCDPLDLTVGPGRVVPLALAAVQYPRVRERLEQLERKLATHRLLPVWEFITRGRPAADEPLSEAEQRILDTLGLEPVSVLDLATRVAASDARLVDLSGLEARGLITRVGLTPTDILHTRGEFTGFDRAAAEAGLRIAARESRLTPETLQARVHELVVRRLATLVLRKCVAEIAPQVADGSGALGAFLLDHAASLAHATAPLDVRLQVTLPIVAIGAPVGAWMPSVAQRLHARLEIPAHADVASAIGAVSGTVTEVVEVLLRPQYARRGVVGYTVHSPVERVQFASKPKAREHILVTGPQIARARAQAAGADSPSIHVEESSWDAASDDPEHGSYLMETRFRFTAVGRPRF